MDKTFPVKSPFQMVTMVTMTFILLNAFLPLNFSPVEAEATESPFKLIITLEKTTYKLTELVNVTWTLINIGEENKTLYGAGTDFLGDFRVYDEDFNLVYQHSHYIGTITVYYPYPPIPPGGNVTCTETWEQIYDDLEVNFETSPWIIRLKHVPPGTYYISGYFWSPTYNITMETTPLRITIIGG
ncbi:MAG: hypothetical protein QHH17_00570 [Candidatus Bathyarchaeota archaeon]|nr:hypothetical protein [Candidatus Bathyarchaeota archaeon]